MNEIKWTKKATKQLLRIGQPKTRKRITNAVAGLSKFPNAENVKPLKNHTCGYRLRVGNYRVLFNHDGICKIISIEEVKKRDERTY